MGWLRLIGSSKLWVSFAKEPYKTDYSLQKRPIILRSLLIVATPYLLHLDPPVELWRSGDQAQFASHYCRERYMLGIIEGNTCPESLKESLAHNHSRKHSMRGIVWARNALTLRRPENNFISRPNSHMTTTCTHDAQCHSIQFEFLHLPYIGPNF